MAVLRFLRHRQVFRPARAVTRNEEVSGITEDLFRSAFDGAAVGSAILGFPRRVVRVNPALCQLLGVREEELIGRDLDAIVHPDDLERAEELSRRLRAGEESPVRAEMRLRCRDGSVRVAEVSTSLIRDAAGAPAFTQAQYLDVTKRREAEEAIWALNLESIQRVGQLAEARAEVRRALVHFTQAQEEQRRFVARALHDDTIQAVTATLWALDDLAEAADPSTRAAVIDRARENLRQAVAAARWLLFELRPPLLDELGFPAAVEQQLSRLTEECGLQTSLVSDLAGRLPTHLETLAFRTTEEALRNVRLHARASSVVVRIGAGAGGLEVVVDDDGVGLDPALASRPAPDGPVGIVSMRETITMAGGTFTVGSGPDGGTRLAFSLPVEGPGPVLPAAPEPGG
jgi:PAS domain S-box-containing protein